MTVKPMPAPRNRRTPAEKHLEDLKARLQEIDDLGCAASVLCVGPVDLHAAGRGTSPRAADGATVDARAQKAHRSGHRPPAR